MKLSIVIPAFNEEKNIGQSVRSLLRQDFKREDYEIIVVDNNSTDRTSAAAREAGADKVVLEKIKGINVARNRGYLESRGEIIAFLDADSEVLGDWMARIVEDLAPEEIAAVSGPYEYYFKGWQGFLAKIYQHFLIPKTPLVLELLFRRKAGVIIGGNFAVKRWAFVKTQGIPTHSFWGDDAFIAMLVSRKAGRVLFDTRLMVKSSSRRFTKEGFFHLPFLYAKAYFKAYFEDSTPPK